MKINIPAPPLLQKSFDTKSCLNSQEFLLAISLYQKSDLDSQDESQPYSLLILIFKQFRAEGFLINFILIKEWLMIARCMDRRNPKTQMRSGAAFFGFCLVLALDLRKTAYTSILGSAFTLQQLSFSVIQCSKPRNKTANQKKVPRRVGW